MMSLRKHQRSSQEALRVQDAALSLLWLPWLLCCGFDPGPGTSAGCRHVPPPPPKKRGKKRYAVIFNAVFKALFLEMWTHLPAPDLESFFQMQISRPHLRDHESEYPGTCIFRKFPDDIDVFCRLMTISLEH